MTQQTLETTLSTKLVEEFSLSPTAAEKILSSFSGTAKSISELDADFKAIAAESQKPVTKELGKKAKELRLKYVKIRTGADKIHKTIKADVLLQSRAIDGAKNLFLLQLSEKENPLMEVEKHFERIEQERIEKVKAKRIAQLEKIGMTEVPGIDLGKMMDEAWDIFFSGQKSVYDKQIADEKIRVAAEKEAAEKEEIRLKEQAIENERVRKENEKLQKEKDAIESKAKKEREAAAKKYLKEQNKLRKEKDAIEKEAREDREAQAKKDREADEAAIAAAKAIKEKAFKEAEAKKNKKYADWLEKNGVKPGDVGEGKEYFLLTNGSVFTLCKRVDSITI